MRFALGLALAAAITTVSARCEAPESGQAGRLSKPEFDRWLHEDPSRHSAFIALSTYLQSRGVGDVVPIWSLTRGDKDRIRACASAGFVIPPRAVWPNLVPALRLVKHRVKPKVGRVEVVSVFRIADLNRCANGAPASRHLSFSALDLIAPDQPDGRTLFGMLCTSWKAAGSKSNWGLGAYFDPTRPTANRQARFHVDATGWRSWGFSKKSASSSCRLISTASVPACEDGEVLT
jgi:Peptidase M15